MEQEETIIGGVLYWCSTPGGRWRPYSREELTHRLVERRAAAARAEAEVARLVGLIDTPHTSDFLAAVPLEAAHQIKRWGVAHDAGKEPQDWFWLVGYLAGKCLRAAIDGDTEKAKHHTVSTAAVMLNWHRRLSGDDQTFRPGTDMPERGED